jgi:hypothetical protein
MLQLGRMIVQCKARSKILNYVREGLLLVGDLVLEWIIGHRSSDRCIVVVVLWRPDRCPNPTGEVL